MRCILFIAVFTIGITALSAQTRWTDKKMFQQKNFVENKGQVTAEKLPNKEIVLYTASIDGVMYYFTRTGYTVSHIEKQKKNKKERAEEKESHDKKEEQEKEREEEKELQFKIIEQFHELKWEGANPSTEIIAENKVTNYYSYLDVTSPDKKGTIIAYAFTKITYKNIYPYTDIVFEFPKDSTGIKYSIYLHPGADAGKVKMRFPGKKFTIKKNNLVIGSDFGKIIDHAPVSYTADRDQKIKSNFKATKDQIGFELKNVPRDKTFVIDPWTATPVFDAVSDGYDVDYDNIGNTFVYGGNGVFTLLKYDPAGTLLWSFSCFSWTYYGDFAVDRSSNNIYLIDGFSSTGAEVVKISPTAVVLATFSGDAHFWEMWRIVFSRCTNQAVIIGGGVSEFTYQSCYLDTNLTSLTPVSYVSGGTPAGIDPAMLALDNYGNCYELCPNSYYGLYPNQLLKLPLPTLFPITYAVNSGYSFQEINSVAYYGGVSFGTTWSNGYNGLCTFNNYVYSYDSYVLKKWDGPSGSLLTSLVINSPAVADSLMFWGGLAGDDCGNLFVADSNTVLQYDSTLTLINSYLMPGAITDVSLSNTGALYVCGTGFVSSLIPSGIVSCGSGTLSVSSSAVDATCTTPGSATVTVTGGISPYSITWNTSPVQYGPTASNLPPGSYVVTVMDDACLRNKYMDTVIVPASGGAFFSTPYIASACSNSSGSIIITDSAGIPPYSFVWSSTVADTNALYDLSPGSYSVTITDGAGCTNTLSGLTIGLIDTIIITATTAGTCLGATDGSINATITGGVSGSPYQYNWTGFPTNHTDSLINVVAGTYTISVTSGGCTDSAIFSVNQFPIIPAIVSAFICTGQTYTLPSGELVNSSGTYTDTMHVTGGCDTIISTVLTVGILSLNVVGDTTIFAGATTSLIASGASSYNWSPSTGLSCITCANPSASPTETTRYCVIASNALCTDSACVTVTVQPHCPDITELQIPDAFSPNNDGNNDLFLLQGWNTCMTDFNIIIYGRWGEKIFESANPEFNWDGTYKGKKLDPAVFVYYVNARLINDTHIERKGNITLIR